MPEVEEEWAQSIIGQALAEIRHRGDVEKVVEKVKCTAVGVRPDLMRVFLQLVESKKKMLRD